MSILSQSSFKMTSNLTSSAQTSSLLSSGFYQSNEPPSSSAVGLIFSCDYCHRKFFNSRAILEHERVHKRERGLESGPGGYTWIASSRQNLTDLIPTRMNLQNDFGNTSGVYDKVVDVEQLKHPWSGCFREDGSINYQGSFGLAEGNMIEENPLQPDLTLKL